ncbi:hypothetical protein GGP41_007469 [Bipolaris sorokiniana]|uniref:Uncharacterized protein n=2 Tax=Cochliobolus sativus TaxID=45130 RepID=A0A8H6E0W0_COCSA|nr:uncharacterized protein COCSADRAFT_23953 [Bipolaris sorokiniana ND90Pr]EMD67596.1 hypothetical protein COCSADRAFT_23953 [Bipolaris sorokiniana ND90Pr]KAF5854673.1 hypothetical protein GGP41_007469 [Bipolaris sorokiniana]
MPTNWNDIKVIEGVLVAYLAANDNKIDLRKVARLYGNSMTFDALACHFKAWKKQATALKAAAVDNTVATPKKLRAKNSSSPTKNTSCSASKKTDKVQAGRVSKNKSVGSGNVKMEDLSDNIHVMIDSEDQFECI